MVLVIGLALAGAGCGSRHAKPAATRSHASRPSSAGGTTCTTKVGTATLDRASGTKLMTVPSMSPFGVAVAPDGRWAFVTTGSEVDVYSLRGGTPHLEHAVFSPDELLGAATTPNGRYLVAATGSGAEVYATSALEHAGDSQPLGSLTSRGTEAIEVAVSPGGRYVFVSLEDSEEVAVFDLERALEHGFGPSDLVGYVPTGEAPVGLSISPNGRYLYATSQDVSPKSNIGTLQVVDLSEAETDPASSVVSVVPAGCNPVRVVSTGDTVYVTARASNSVLAFSAHQLVADSNVSPEHFVEVGEEPVGLALVDRDRDLVVADSNRFDVEGGRSTLSVVLLSPSGAMTLRAYLPAGAFPRDMALTPNGRLLLVCNYDSNQLEIVPIGRLPSGG